MSYLLEKKIIEVQIETDIAQILLPTNPVRVVLSNLIRNAFQHTWEGIISITQRQDSIDIVNRSIEGVMDINDLGFG